MRVVVVGARGFIGRHLVRRLGELNHVTAAVTSQDPRAWGHDGILRLAEPTGPVDAVYYLSQSPRWRPPDADVRHMWAVNVQSALVAADWAQKHGARRFIYASTGNVYSPSFQPMAEDAPLEPDSCYALSKVHAEQALAEVATETDVTAVRIFGVYGADQVDRIFPRLVSAISHGNPIRLTRAEHEAGESEGMRLSMCHVADAVDVLIKLGEVRGQPAVNLAGPEPTSVRALAEEIGGALGLTPRFETMDALRSRDFLADTNLLARLVGHDFQSLAEGVRESLAESLSHSQVPDGGNFEG